MRPLLLLTRPEPQARKFATLAQTACPPHDLLIAPLSQIVAVSFDPAVFVGAAAVVLTSANAVPMVAQHITPGLPAWCVGPATAKAAAKAGLEVLEGGGDAEALIARLTKARPAGPLVHAHGVHMARDLVAALQPVVDLHGVAVYEAQALDWSKDVRQAVCGAPWVIAPLFSPRAADHFVQQLEGTCPNGMRVVAISEACAAKLPKGFRKGTTVAQSPDSAGMIDAIASEMSQTGKDGLRQTQPRDR